MDDSKFLTATILVSALSIPTITHAALVGRLAATEGGTDYKAFYDTETDLTWLADANAGAGSVYETWNPGSGSLSWSEATTWAANLDVDGVSGWRLPSTLDPDPTCVSLSATSSINCNGSEMGNLFYNVLGNAGNYIGAVTMAPFSNAQAGWYWSSTEYADGYNEAWLFNMYAGEQNHTSKNLAVYAWAVQSGDVSAVPVPAAVWLFGSGLICLIGFARRK